MIDTCNHFIYTKCSNCSNKLHTLHRVDQKWSSSTPVFAALNLIYRLFVCKSFQQISYSPIIWRSWTNLIELADGLFASSAFCSYPDLPMWFDAYAFHLKQACVPFLYWSRMRTRQQVCPLRRRHWWHTRSEVNNNSEQLG